jgi:hypothetical protein
VDTAAGAKESVISFVAVCSVQPFMLYNFGHLFLGQQVRDGTSGLQKRVTDLTPSNISHCDHHKVRNLFKMQGFFLSEVGLTSPGTVATSGLLYSPR